MRLHRSSENAVVSSKLRHLKHDYIFISILLSTTVLSFSRCNKNLASKDGLRRHMESVHETIGKNFVCPTCGNRFLRKEYLAKHLKTHEFNYEVLPADTTTVSASPSVSS